MSIQFALTEDYLDDEDLMLNAAGELDGKPVVTERALADFVSTWADNDPNGVWGQVSVALDGPTPGTPMLCVTRSDSTDPSDWMYFPAVPDTYPPSSEPLFVLDGWQMVRAS